MLNLGFLSPCTTVSTFQTITERICGNFAIQSDPTNRSFHGRIGMVTSPNMDIGLIEVPKCKVERDMESIRRSPIDTVFLLYQETGSALLTNGAFQAVITEGDFALIDATRPSVFEFSSGTSQQVSIPLQRTDAVERFGATACAGMVVRNNLASTKAVGDALNRMLQQGADEVSSEIFLQSIAAALREHMGFEDHGLSLTRRMARVHEVVAGNYPDPDFDANHLADKLGVNLRSLQRLLQSLGFTPREYLLHVRLEAARIALTSSAGRRERIKISNIAYDCGFNDLSYFYRKFSRAYGQNPGDFHRTGLGRSAA